MEPSPLRNETSEVGYVEADDDKDCHTLTSNLSIHPFK